MRDKMAVVNVNSYTWYGGSEANLEETATNIASVLNAKPGNVVNEPSPITLVAF